MKCNWFILGLYLSVLAACQSEKPTQRKLEADPDPNSPSSMIKIPVDENGNIDESKVARIEFDTIVYDFGIVKEGELVTKSFQFTNTGAVSLILYDAKSTCGCTVPEIPKEPVPPGEKGILGVTFNTNGKTGKQSKTVTVTANTVPSQTQIMLRGEVTPKPK